jgi:glutamine synthetase
MGTDTGTNLLEPGDTPHENLQFLFFCTAVIRRSTSTRRCCARRSPTPGQDHRLGANEAPAGDHLDLPRRRAREGFNAIESGSGDAATPQSYHGLGASVLPRLPMHGGDRNRTSPFAFTGNKFEFRALGSSASLGLPNTVLNTIAAEAIDALADELEAKLSAGTDLAAAVLEVVGPPTPPTRPSCSGATTTPRSGTPRPSSAACRTCGRRPTPCPWLVDPGTVKVFEKYDVLRSASSRPATR